MFTIAVTIALPVDLDEVRKRGDLARLRDRHRIEQRLDQFLRPPRIVDRRQLGHLERPSLFLDRRVSVAVPVGLTGAIGHTGAWDDGGSLRARGCVRVVVGRGIRRGVRVEVRGARTGAVNVGRLEEASDPREDLAFGERRGHVGEFACSVFEVDGELWRRVSEGQEREEWEETLSVALVLLSRRR
jgi:hypothetical protein